MDSAYAKSGSESESDDEHHYSDEQTQLLEAFFKEFPDPDEKQIQELSRDLGLDPRQMKFWFEFKRIQEKIMNKIAENNTLRAENEKIRRENNGMRETLINNACLNCQGSILEGQD